MRRPVEIAREEAAMVVLTDLTSAFEGIASMRIAQTKNQVLQSTQFFDKLWQIYTQLRVDPLFNFGRDRNADVLDKELFIIITAEGGFSGDIDQKLVKFMLKSYQQDRNDIIVIGRHGAMQLSQHGIPFIKYYRLPVKDKNINVSPIIRHIQQYAKCSVFFQEYISLMSQEVRRISLAAVVQTQGAHTERSADIISEDTYIFEPSSYSVAAYLERSMMQIAVSQLILESKLAQFASRFRAMSAAHERARDTRDELHLMYNRARRAQKDERLKEIINGIKKGRAGAVAV